MYVDPLQDFGWVLRGRRVQNCHLFTDSLDLAELHAVAAAIGMRLSWFQSASRVAPHYDLTASRRALAIAAGAREVSRREAAAIWRQRRSDAGAIASGGGLQPREGICPDGERQ
ncbi:DUF4031 domain-containing protein [Ottowia sp.]|uniref:DUF4031 domain-containing protein n=1 Tax=Ottowia sp. TaxID=1898956 RepID=UPI0025CE00A9|nr:DUF4031 domain-containing protein [Ottowia sp.]